MGSHGRTASASLLHIPEVSPAAIQAGSPTDAAETPTYQSASSAASALTKNSAAPFSRHGHWYNNINVSGSSRVHFGDVYNYHNSDLAQKAVLDWLTSIDPSHSHNQACTQYQDDTLRWFLGDDRFQKWCYFFEGSSPRILWCRGDPGTGKTILIAQVLCHLLNIGTPMGSIATVYCRYAERNIQTFENILGSLLAQLFQTSEQEFDIPPHIECASRSQPWYWKRRPSSEDLKLWLGERLKTSRPMFILVDALDELDTITRQRLLNCLLSTMQSDTKLIVTSRHVPENDAATSDVQTIEIFAHQDDLRTVVDAKLHEEDNERFQSWISGRASRDPNMTTLEEEISSKVVASAGEMYVCVGLYLLLNGTDQVI